MNFAFASYICSRYKEIKLRLKRSLVVSIVAFSPESSHAESVSSEALWQLPQYT